VSDVSGRPQHLRVITVVLAVACGLTVANLYYAQPLLDLIAGAFHVARGTAALVVTMTQIGYVLGLLFVLPVGDLLENRVLVIRTLVGTAAALILAGAAPDFGVFLAASVLVGLTSVVAQILVPLAAHLAPAGQEGRFVGRVMSGLLLGILLARTAASLLAQAAGWRMIFFVSAALMLGLAVVIYRVLPIHRPQADHTYRELLASVAQLVRHEPVLRRLALCHATAFGAFSAFWTAIAYQLIAQHGFSQAQIGLFALVGAAGAAAAPVGGWVADHGYGWRARAVALALAAVSMAAAGFGAGSVVVLALAAVFLDLAVQSHQVMSQQVMYQLHPAARARSNTVYMSTVFTVAAVCSAVAGALYDGIGWSGVMVFATALPLGGLLIWATGRTTVPVDQNRDIDAAMNSAPD
jgi:predicted MFS family arabinose efflux permease